MIAKYILIGLSLITLCMEVLGNEESNYWLQQGMDYASYHHNNDELALLCFNKSLALNPSDWSAWREKACSLYRLGRYNESAECWDKFIELTINTNAQDWGLTQKADALAKAGRTEESLKCYDEAIKINPSQYDAWVWKGELLEELHRYEEALKCYDAATAIDPEQSSGWISECYLLDEMGKYEEELRCLDDCIAVEQNDGWAWLKKADVLRKLGRDSEADDLVKTRESSKIELTKGKT